MARSEPEALVSLAAPVTYGGDVVAAISVLGPVSTIRSPGLEASVRAAARRISADLSGEAARPRSCAEPGYRLTTGPVTASSKNPPVGPSSGSLASRIGVLAPSSTSCGCRGSR